MPSRPVAKPFNRAAISQIFQTAQKQFSQAFSSNSTFRLVWWFALVVVAFCLQLTSSFQPNSSECWACVLSAMASFGCSVLALAVLEDRKTTALALTSAASLLTLVSVLVAWALVVGCASHRAMLVLIAFNSIVAPVVLLLRQ